MHHTSNTPVLLIFRRHLTHEDFNGFQFYLTWCYGNAEIMQDLMSNAAEILHGMASHAAEILQGLTAQACKNSARLDVQCYRSSVRLDVQCC